MSVSKLDILRALVEATPLERPIFAAAGLIWTWQIGSQAWRADGPDYTLHVYRVWRGVYEAQDGTRFPRPEQAAEHGWNVTFGGGEAA